MSDARKFWAEDATGIDVTNKHRSSLRLKINQIKVIGADPLFFFSPSSDEVEKGWEGRSWVSSWQAILRPLYVCMYVCM